MVIWVRTLGSKEIRLGSQVRKQEQANILKWGFLFVVSPMPTWNPEWCHRRLVPSLLFSWMSQFFRLVSQQCFQNVLFGNKRKTNTNSPKKKNNPRIRPREGKWRLVLYLTKFFPIKLRKREIIVSIHTRKEYIHLVRMEIYVKAKSVYECIPCYR